MRVFVTGATGFIGSAIVHELRGAGHQVLGLARSDASAKALAAAGAEVHRGSLEDLESLRSGAKASDGVIHTAFVHDFSKYAESCEKDRHAIESIGGVLRGMGRPFVVTSGTAFLPQGRLGSEADEPNQSFSPRVGAEKLALSLAENGVRVSLVRLPPTVHGDGDHGFVPLLIGIARQKGVSAYIGEGRNRWPAVHRLDAAHLFRLALEKAPAGMRLHGVAEEGIAFREIAEVIGRRLKLPVVSKASNEVAGHFGWFADFASIDNPVSSKRTQELLGWRPKQPGLIADLDRESYFAE